MKIGIDCRMWDESGIGRYLRNLIYYLAKIDKDNEYVLFLLKKNRNLDLPKNFLEVEADFKWYGFSEQVKFPRLLKKYNLDLVHFPHFNIPILYNGKFVVTIHDLIHQHFSFNRSSTLNPVMHSVKKIGYQKAFNSAAKNSLKILTPSEYVKKQLVDQWSLKADKIIVTYEGVDDNILKLAKSDLTKIFQGLSVKFEIKSPFLYYIGNAHPHKNIDQLLQVFQIIKKDNSDLQLVLSGKRNYFWDKVLKGFEDMVVFTGFIGDEEAVALYRNAQAYVMPSLEEGFGIPILEAMACGCPVVSSQAGSLKEIGGDAAIYFDPINQNDMKEKITSVLSDQKLRGELIKKGKERVKEFSWEKMAQQTLEVYDTL